MGRRRRAGNAATILLVIVLVFQVTVLPDTMHIRGLGRVANAAALLCFTVAALSAAASRRIARVPAPYLVAVLLVIIGCSINIARSLSPESLGAAGVLLAWVAAVSVPFMRSFSLERAWRLFYHFMFWASAVAVAEYVCVFAGLINTTPIETDRGEYLKGIFTIFFGLDDGSVNYRMYGMFAEPGTFAMYLLPAIAYAWLRGRYHAVLLFVLCMYLADSLGGWASLVVMTLTYLFWRSRKRPAALLIITALAIAGFYAASGRVRAEYEQKGGSATVREDNVTLFRDNFASIITANPFGMPLTGRSLSELENVTNNYLGSNFEIYTVFVKGGVLACLGYTILLIWMLLRNIRALLGGDRDPARAAALVCLPAMIMFVFQRDTILASALFAYLFAQPLLRPTRAALTASVE